MALYRPSPRTGVFMTVGDTGTNWELLDEITGTGINPNAPQTPQADATMSLYAGAVAARAQAGSAGTAEYTFNQADALVALQELERLRGTTTSRVFREEQGEIAEIVGTGTVTGAIATAAGVSTLTLAGTNAPDDLQNSQVWKEGMLVVIGTEAYTIERFTGAKTAVVSPAGSVASNVVTPATEFAALTTVASAAVKAYEYSVRREFTGTLNTLVASSSATDRTATVTLQMGGFETKTFLLDNAARTIPLPG